MPNTLIIGMGISAVAYLQSVQLNPGEKVTTLGGPELWSRMEKDHKMGQPTPLLTGNLLAESRAFAAPPKLGENFMLAKDFAALLDQHLRAKSSATVPGAWVELISREGMGYSVRIKPADSDAIVRKFDKVIIAAGPGPSRPLMAGDDGKVEVNVNGMDGFVVGGTDFMSPDWKLPPQLQTRPIVAVYGGSATAAWAVELAILRGYNVSLWFTRPGEGASAWDPDKRFSEAFPPGERNVGVETHTRDVRKVLKLVDVRFYKLGIASFIMLEFRDQQDTPVRIPVDILVYALGAAHAASAGVRRIIAKGIQDDLVPHYDKNFAITSKPTLLAVGTADRSLMIVGSAMSSAGGFNLNQLFGKLAQEEQELLKMLAPYKDISDSLPPAARPTEGIAMVMAGMEALNTFMPATPIGGKTRDYSPPARITADKTGHTQPDKGSINPAFGQTQTHAMGFQWDINFNTSNRTQLAAYLAQTTDLTPLAANLAVALIVSLRAQARNPLGLTNEQVGFIIRRAEWFAGAQETYNKGLEQRRLAYDHSYGADWYLNVLVDLMTKDPNQTPHWERQGIRCG